MNAADIHQLISKVTMSGNEINSLIDLLVEKRRRESRKIAYELYRGDIVKFVSGAGRHIKGKVVKLNPKTCIIEEIPEFPDSRTSGTWRVAYAFISKA